MDANKEELFLLLAEYIAEETPPKWNHIESTFDMHVKCTPADMDTTQLEPCTHEEADTRILIHVADWVAHGNRKVTFRTTDTDVVVSGYSRGLGHLWLRENIAL